MAFTRRSLAALGLNEEQVDKVMALHGTSMSDFIPKSELQERIDTALADAQKSALQSAQIKETDEYKAVAEERDMLRALGGDDFASVKPKFRETVYKMLERGENAPAIAEQLKSVAEKYEEYFTKPEPAQPAAPQFGGEVKGQMPTGKAGTSFMDVWGYDKKG